MWTTSAVRAFWEHNQAIFSGDTVAAEVLRRTASCVKGRVLDVGAGSGKLLSLLPRGAVGIDIAPHSSACGSIIKGNVVALPFGDEMFQTIFLTDVAEHLSPEALRVGMHEVYRVLAPGGYAILTTPNNEDIAQNTVWCPRCSAHFHRWGHTQVFNRQSVQGFLTEAGAWEKIKVEELPLGLIAEHRLLRYFWPLLNITGYCKRERLLVVARKVRA